MSQPSRANRPLDHVGIAVPSLEEACRLFEVLLGETSSPPEVLEAQGVRIAFVGAVGLLEPLGPQTTIGRSLERRGPGLHHLAHRLHHIKPDTPPPPAGRKPPLPTTCPTSPAARARRTRFPADRTPGRRPGEHRASRPTSSRLLRRYSVRRDSNERAKCVIDVSFIRLPSRSNRRTASRHSR